MNNKYSCIRCGKNFRMKIHYKNHLDRKNICEPIYKDIEIEILKNHLNNNNTQNFYNECFNVKKNEYHCTYCKKNFSNKSNLTRHQKKYCNFINNNLVSHNNNSQIIQGNIINNIVNNNIHIHINSIGNEKFNIKEITEKLNFELNYSNFNGIKFKYDDRINNLIDNYGIIFDNIYENPDNHNFAIVNKNKKICKIKDSEDGIKHINFEDLTHKIFNIIDNVFDLSIIEFEMNNDKESLYHYKEFKKKLVERRNMFIEKYYSSDNSFEKKNIYNSLYQYFKGFKNLVNNIKDKIILKSYDIDL